ncbi:MAG: divalent-cation tolerance protein CutA [Opitutales bacterium]
MTRENTLLIGWTTVESEADARRLAADLVNAGLAACVQLDGPIYSVFPWKGAVEEASEWRLMVKFTEAREGEVAEFLDKRHPYETPEWVTVRASHVASEYLKWAREVTSR